MSQPTVAWSRLLDHLLAGGVLREEEATALMEAWLAETLTPVQTGHFWLR